MEGRAVPEFLASVGKVFVNSQDWAGGRTARRKVPPAERDELDQQDD